MPSPDVAQPSTFRPARARFRPARHIDRKVAGKRSPSRFAEGSWHDHGRRGRPGPRRNGLARATWTPGRLLPFAAGMGVPCPWTLTISMRASSFAGP